MPCPREIIGAQTCIRHAVGVDDCEGLLRGQIERQHIAVVVEQYRPRGGDGSGVTPMIRRRNLHRN